MPAYLYTFDYDHVATLVTYLVHHLTQQDATLAWQVCWLQNNDQPIIGLLPRVSWCVYPVMAQQQYNPNKSVMVEVVKQNRPKTLSKDRALQHDMEQDCQQRYHTSFSAWVDELIAYAQTHASKQPYVKPPSIHNPTTNTQHSSYHEGLMGFIGYDITARQLSPNSSIRLADQPCAFMGHYDVYLTPYIDANNSNAYHNKWQLHIATNMPTSLITRVDKCLTALAQLTQSELADVSATPCVPLYLNKTWKYQDYKAAFERTQYHLHQGDSYQINLTQRWYGSLTKQAAIPPQNNYQNNHQGNSDATNSDLFLVNYLPKLYLNTQAPYSGYLNVQNFELISCSPELFFTFTVNPCGEVKIFTKPIKGTRPRSEDKNKDEALKDALIHSEKDRSENVMIVDLLRNDLGKYAKTGSVTVPKLFAIESFSNVHHMVSTITATMKQDVHPLRVLFDSLPAGSITGAPKKRSVELIAKLESHPRGAYCGTMGYMNFEGSGQWNVLIRSLQKTNDNDLTLWAGGGITVRSDCADEYQECTDKVGNLLAILSKN